MPFQLTWKINVRMFLLQGGDIISDRPINSGILVGKNWCISAHQGQWSVHQVQSWDRISSLAPGEMYAIPALSIPLITRKHMDFGHFKGHLGIERYLYDASR